nr:Unknown Function [uncultured bacterium]
MKKYTVIGIVIVAVIAVAVIIMNRYSKNEGGLTGKNVRELAALNTPISCTKPVLESEKPAAGVATEIPTKLWILGTHLKEEGVTIQTDGKEGPTSTNILTDTVVYTKLLGTNKMLAIEDTQFTQSLRAAFNDISASTLSCTHDTFDASAFKPTDVCYAPTSSNKPTCDFGNTD